MQNDLIGRVRANNDTIGKLEHKVGLARLLCGLCAAIGCRSVLANPSLPIAAVSVIFLRVERSGFWLCRFVCCDDLSRSLTFPGERPRADHCAHGGEPHPLPPALGEGVAGMFAPAYRDVFCSCVAGCGRFRCRVCGFVRGVLHALLLCDRLARVGCGLAPPWHEGSLRFGWVVCRLSDSCRTRSRRTRPGSSRACAPRRTRSVRRLVLLLVPRSALSFALPCSHSLGFVV